MADLLGHTAAGDSIDKLYLAAGTIRNNDIRAGGGNAVGFFIRDFLG
jgi:hypothetical protein